MRRRILALGAIATLVTALGIGFGMTTADAHHALLSGVASCPAADHVIDWSIGNSQPKEPMTIVSVAARLGATDYGVSGYTSPLPPAGSTSAQTVIPGALTGSVTLWVHGEWTDGHTSGRHVSVDLSTPCDASTTVPGPTTSMPTPTSVSEPPSVPPSVPVATVPPSGTGGGSLAFTGAGTAVGGALGCSLVAMGLALRGRRKRTFAER